MANYENLKKFINNFINDDYCETYIAQHGKRVYRQSANLDWFLLECRKLGYEPHCVNAYKYFIITPYFELDYTERSVTLLITFEGATK